MTPKDVTKMFSGSVVSIAVLEMFNEACVKELAVQLKINRSLKSFRASHSHLTNEGASAIIDALTVNPSFEDFEIGMSNVSKESIDKIRFLLERNKIFNSIATQVVRIENSPQTKEQQERQILAYLHLSLAQHAEVKPGNPSYQISQEVIARFILQYAVITNGETPEQYSLRLLHAQMFVNYLGKDDPRRGSFLATIAEQRQKLTGSTHQQTSHVLSLSNFAYGAAAYVSAIPSAVLNRFGRI